ncbi:amyloid fiber anchoring/assembly protein TapA [Mesobacillus maritimus]|uniref:amyloid fiber anchoring/assembly protein TapA n=1 Tax=Mesobacillus maritimus TaxID=1643336 RepID=UPI00203DA7C5|nr:amyloid fiber anchoring/assembly protein TapA [Mesobacillus maritimus]MCM3585496.1 amyloid fiber anchoring/assembly protein TapA [Mesobacillus maritimus]
MRSTRSKKLRTRRKGIIIVAKLVSIWYILIFTSSYMTSYTGAYFNDVETLTVSFQAENPKPEQPEIDSWDRSSLDIDAKGTSAWADGYRVFATVRNSGDRDITTSTWVFYLYKIIDGKPTGEPIAEGVVPKIPSGELGEMKATVTEPGVYAFTVRRPLGHPAKNNPDKDGYTYLGWSNYITVEGVKNSEKPEKTEPTPSSKEEDKSQNPVVENKNEEVNQSKDISEGEDISSGKSEENEQNPPMENVEEEKTSENIPEEIRDLEATRLEKGNSGWIQLKWRNPTNPDFSHVNIYIDGQTAPIFKHIQNQAVEIQGKDDEVTYIIKTVNKDGTESTGTKIIITKAGIEQN